MRCEPRVPAGISSPSSAGRLMTCMEQRPGGTDIYVVDITADLNDEDETGYVWTFLDEARDPAQISPCLGRL
jgi:hypothetical protein